MDAQSPPPAPRRRAALLVGAFAVTAPVLAWTYWTTLGELARKWHLDPQYSHGYLVPVFCLYLLYGRRDLLRGQALRPTWFAAVPLLLCLALRAAGGYWYRQWLEHISILPCAAGLCLAFGGWGLLRWAWQAVAFLVFMLPLPHTLEVALGGPLQTVATLASTYVIQTLGQPALAEGNTILLNEVTLGIAEACSGLRMLVIFFALSTATALVAVRPAWEKSLIVLSAAPIALAANVIRITATALAHIYLNRETADAIFHDLAGWFMMPVALAMLWAEFQVLSFLLPAEPSDEPAFEG